MPAPRSSGRSQRQGSGSSAAKPAAPKPARSKATPAAKSASASKKSGSQAKAPKKRQTRSGSAGVADGVATFVEQLVNRVIKPLDLVLLSRERIEEVLDDAAARGRVTRGDANDLVAELVRRGRQQTDDLFRDAERMFDLGRGQLGSATKQSVGRIVRGADRARRTIGGGSSFPISGYDELTSGQVEQRLTGLRPAELRHVRDYERRHANRKSVLEAIERALA